MDLHHLHPTRVDAVRACHHDDATDLLAVAGEHTVDILLVSHSACQTIASFYVGHRITALAWSSVTVSPTVSDDWHIELAVADTNYGLHLLTKSSKSDESSFAFGGGLSGHHGKINDMTFCGGRGPDSSRYIATVSDDKMLMVWDLLPGYSSSPASSSEYDGRPRPTAYAITFQNPLTTINSHPSTSKEFLVSDCRGSIFLTNWRADPQEMDQDSWKNQSLLELVEPSTLASHLMAQNSNLPLSIGAVYGSRFSIWDIGNLRGGKPLASGQSFSAPAAGHRFRWCPTYPDYFAISAQTPTQGALIHIHNTNYFQAQPTELTLLPKPHIIQDFDFLALRGIPRIAAAVGSKVFIFPIGVDA
ncbi:hypothetical protein H0H92_008660 [Tricholoma furcatifolium]|nr:hypothetical protein H0H92_008660 [Tricholoma furcatifolium]